MLLDIDMSNYAAAFFITRFDKIHSVSSFYILLRFNPTLRFDLVLYAYQFIVSKHHIPVLYIKVEWERIFE
jgi:hypothetical protein